MGIEFYIALLSIFIIGIVLGAAIIFIFRRTMVVRQFRIAERKAARTIAEASLKSKEMLREAKQEAEKARSAAEAEYRDRRSELQRQENRLSQKTENLERKLDSVEQRERNTANKEGEIESMRTHLDEIRNRQLKQLELISGMSSAEAKQALSEAMELEMQEEASRRIR